MDHRVKPGGDMLSSVMAGLVPAISFHVAMPCQIIEIAGTSASQATPFFKRLCPAMTDDVTITP